MGYDELEDSQHRRLTIDDIYELCDDFDAQTMEELVDNAISNGVEIVDNNYITSREIGVAEAIDDGGISLLLRELKAYPELTLDEELELAKRMEQGDEFAKEMMINSHMKLVVSIAYKYINKGVQIEDLVSGGSMGLMIACDRYDYRKGVRFGSYAFWWIRDYLRFTLADCGQVVRLPAYIYNKLCRYKRSVYELVQRDGVVPTDEQIASYMGEDIDTIKTLQSCNQSVVELDSSKDDEGMPSSVGNFIADTNHTIDKEKIKDNIIDLFDMLTERERTVLERRFAVTCSSSQTLEDIGNQMGLTKERVRHLESSAMRKLRHPLNLVKIYK